MANFEVLETYNSEIEKLEPTTPGHADVFNAIFQQLINNDAFIKKVAEQQLTIIQSHLNNENEPHQKVFDTYYRQLVNYTDKAIADLINGAPETADTLRELADLIDKNKDVATALNEAIGKKANQTELDQAISNIDTLNKSLVNLIDFTSDKTSHTTRYCARFSNGLQICFGIFSNLQAACNKTSGNGYYGWNSDENGLTAFVQPFFDMPVVTVSILGGNSMCIRKINSTKTVITLLEYMSTEPRDLATTVFHYIAIGRWK